jgi:hypothetical protein
MRVACEWRLEYTIVGRILEQLWIILISIKEWEGKRVVEEWRKEWEKEWEEGKRNYLNNEISKIYEEKKCD